MSTENIFDIVVESVCCVMPSLKRGDVTLSSTLRELGANSIDRAEILSVAVEKLQIRTSLVRLGIPETIQELVDSLASAGS